MPTESSASQTISQPRSCTFTDGDVGAGVVGQAGPLLHQVGALERVGLDPPGGGHPDLHGRGGLADGRHHGADRARVEALLAVHVAGVHVEARDPERRHGAGVAREVARGHRDRRVDVGRAGRRWGSTGASPGHLLVRPTSPFTGERSRHDMGPASTFSAPTATSARASARLSRRMPPVRPRETPLRDDQCAPPPGVIRTSPGAAGLPLVRSAASVRLGSGGPSSRPSASGSGSPAGCATSRAASGPCSSRRTKPSSSRIGTFAATALSYFEPGSSPTTTKAVFFDTDPAARPPRARIASLASSRDQVGQRPGDDDREPLERARHRLVGLLDEVHPGGAPLLDDLAVPVHGEPLADRRRDRRARPRRRRPAPPRSAASMASTERKCRARACAAVGPTWRMDSPTSTFHSGRCRALSRFASSLRPFAERFAGLRAEQRDAREVVLGEREHVALVLHDPGREQRRRRLVAEDLDVERAAPGDVEQPLAQLRGTGPGVGAAQVLVALAHLPQLGAALGAVGGHDERVLVARCGPRRPARAPRG